MNRRDISATGSLENVSPRTKWSAAVFAGFTGALAFFVWQILVMWLTAEQPPWTTVRLIASVVLGEEGARAPIDFDLLLTVVAAAVHLALSIGFACLVAPLLREFSRLGWRRAHSASRSICLRILTHAKDDSGLGC